MRSGRVSPAPRTAQPTGPPICVLQIGSYYGSEITSVDIDGDGVTDVLLVGAPMYFSEGREQGRVYVYNLRQVPLRRGHPAPAFTRASVRETGPPQRGQRPPAEPGRGQQDPPLSLGLGSQRGGSGGTVGWRQGAASPCLIPLSLVPPLVLQNRFVYNGTLKDSHNYQNARFGSSIASVRDLNQDSYNDVVVGAPLEDNHRGAIYIFHGFQASLLKTPKQVRRPSKGLELAQVSWPLGLRHPVWESLLCPAGKDSNLS